MGLKVLRFVYSIDPKSLRDQRTFMELLDAYSRAVVSEVDVESVDDLHRFLSDWPIGKPVDMNVIRGQRKQVLMVTPEEAGA